MIVCSVNMISASLPAKYQGYKEWLIVEYTFGNTEGENCSLNCSDLTYDCRQ